MKNDSQKQGNFVSHLTELRTRIIHSFYFLICFFIISFYFSEEIYNFLVQPYADAVKNDSQERRLIFTALQETFITYLKVSFFAAFFASSPLILIQIWKFVAPGLYDNERKALMPYLIVTPLLFFLGGLLVYYLIMPLAIKFFLSFETTLQGNSLPIQLEAKVNEYLSLIMKLIFAFGISFQLPVILSLLARVGFIDSDYLKKKKKICCCDYFCSCSNFNTTRSCNTNRISNPITSIIRSINMVSKNYRKKNKRKRTCII